MEDESEEDVRRSSKRAKAFDGKPSQVTVGSQSDHHELEANRRRKPNQAAKASVGTMDEEQNIVNQKREKAFHGQPSDGFQSDVDDHELEVNRLQKLNHKASVGFDDEDMVDDKIEDKSMADADHNNDNQHSLVSVQQEHPETEAEASCMDDIISTLPSTIVDTILCFLPIKDAVRTSTLSSNWKYNWVTIPKLVFHWRDMRDKTTFELLGIIHQVLPLHQGPILEFSLTTDSLYDEIIEDIDEIISHLVRNNNTMKKVTLNLNESNPDTDTPLYVLPLSFFSLHQLTDLYLKDCTFPYNLTHSGFPCLTSLFLESNNYMITISKKALLRFLSNCPRLKQLEMVLSGLSIDEDITLTEISKCLPVIEHLSSYRWTFQRSEQINLRQKLPIALVHLKYLCLNMMNLFDDDGFRFIGFVIKNSPNLEKIKLEVADNDFGEEDIQLVTLRDCADIWLEHLKELEIEEFSSMESEMEFVKLILAKSPVLKNVNITVDGYLPDIELEVLSIDLLNSPRASPLVKIIVDQRRPHAY